MGSSGYRKIPGNTCEGGVKKDEKVQKKCSLGRCYFFFLGFEIGFLGLMDDCTQLNLLKERS